MKNYLLMFLLGSFIFSNAYAQNPQTNTQGKPTMTTKKTIDPVAEFIKKNDNILFYMEEAIKQNDITHEDYLVVFNRWKEIKQINNEFKRNPKKYNPEYFSEFNEQEMLFSDYVKTMYSYLVNQSANLNNLNFRFDVENNNLVIMVPNVSTSVADEFKRSNYLNPTSSKFKEIVDLGFEEIKLTDGKKSILLISTINKKK